MKIYARNVVTGRLAAGYSLLPYEITNANVVKGTHGGKPVLKLVLEAKKEGIPASAHVDLFGEARVSFMEDSRVQESGIERLVGREVAAIMHQSKGFIAGVALNI